MIFKKLAGAAVLAFAMSASGAAFAHHTPEHKGNENDDCVMDKIQEAIDLVGPVPGTTMTFNLTQLQEACEIETGVAPEALELFGGAEFDQKLTMKW